MPGLQAGPLGDGAADPRRSRPGAVGTKRMRTFRPLWPAGRRVLPRLLSPVDGQVEQPVAVVHRLDAAPRRPVSLENLGSVSQIANEIKHARPASNQQGVERAWAEYQGSPQPMKAR